MVNTLIFKLVRQQRQQQQKKRTNKSKWPMYLKISKQIPQAIHHPSHYRHSIRNSKVDKGEEGHTTNEDDDD